MSKNDGKGTTLKPVIRLAVMSEDSDSNSHSLDGGSPTFALAFANLAPSTPLLRA